MIDIILALLLSFFPGESVPFVAVCREPDVLARMSEIQQKDGMAAGAPTWIAARTSGECVQLPSPAVGTLVEKLGSWHGTYDGKTYNWSLWSLDYQGHILYGLFPDVDGPSA